MTRAVAKAENPVRICIPFRHIIQTGRNQGEQSLASAQFRFRASVIPCRGCGQRRIERGPDQHFGVADSWQEMKNLARVPGLLRRIPGLRQSVCRERRENRRAHAACDEIPAIHSRPPRTASRKMTSNRKVPRLRLAPRFYDQFHLNFRVADTSPAECDCHIIANEADMSLSNLICLGAFAALTL